MNNRPRSAVFPSSLLKLIILLKKVTARGIESRLRRVMTGAEEKQHSISVMEISAFMIYYWWSSQHGGWGYSLSVYVSCPGPVSQSRSILHPGACDVHAADSTCELSPAPEPGACEKLWPGRDSGPVSQSRSILLDTCDEARVREEAGRDSDMNKFLTILWL